MSPRPLRILVLKTGEALPSLVERRGGFFELFRAGLNPSGGPPVDIVPLDITARGESDPLPDLDAVDGVLMTGSPAMVAQDTGWMRYGAQVIRAAVDKEHPFLGVCFGHQLLGVALGADVGPNPMGREIGSVDVSLLQGADDALLASLPRAFVAQVSHVDVIRSPGPRLEVLGRAPHDGCHVVRAGRWAWGVQFHPEFDEEVVLEYLRSRHHLLDANHGDGAAQKQERRVSRATHAAALLARFAGVCATKAAREERRHAS
jgi:GMP synthase (glutamine-hydrolysing)